MGFDSREMNMGKTEFTCLKCGNCCKRYAHEISLTNEDIELWKFLDRKDLLFHPFIDLETKLIVPISDVYSTRKEIKEILTYAEKQTGIKFPWGNLFRGCIFLKRRGKTYECLIHCVKPEMCRNFPFNEYGEVDFARKNIYSVCPAVTEFAKRTKQS